MRPAQAPGRATALGLLALLAAGALWGAVPSPTPTPRPRLSGGFGRPRAAPASSPQVGESPSGPRPEKAGVVIRNDTLVTSTQKGKVSTSGGALVTTTPQPASRTSAAEVPLATTGTPTPDPSSPAEASEAEWRAAAKSARDRVEQGKSLVRQFTAEAAKLESDFYSWDDGQYRDNVIKPAWDKKKEELETAKKELALAEKDLADLPEKARKAGALPGWLRE